MPKEWVVSELFRSESKREWLSLEDQQSLSLPLSEAYYMVLHYILLPCPTFEHLAYTVASISFPSALEATVNQPTTIQNGKPLLELAEREAERLIRQMYVYLNTCLACTSAFSSGSGGSLSHKTNRIHLQCSLQFMLVWISSRVWS